MEVVSFAVLLLGGGGEAGFCLVSNSKVSCIIPQEEDCGGTLDAERSFKPTCTLWR